MLASEAPTPYRAALSLEHMKLISEKALGGSWPVVVTVELYEKENDTPMAYDATGALPRRHSVFAVTHPARQCS
jgi:hypothetical protein